MPLANKLQRWVDILAALLGRRCPASFDELAGEVPAYTRAVASDCTPKEKASIKRTFERDKRELRTLGVPLERVVGGGKRSLPAGARVKIELMSERRFRNGVVHAQYRIEN